MKVACCILSYNITKGMKSFGPIGMLKKNQKSKELILLQIENIRRIFGSADIYLITGFGSDKIHKLVQNKKYVKIIENDQFATKNYGYSLKLFLHNIESKIDDYQGFFFIDSNILITNLLNKKKNKSWIVCKKNTKTAKKTEDFIGFNNIDETISYMFYNLGDYSWCNSFYLSKNDIKKVITYKDYYYDNMFLFEILNLAIEKFDLKLFPNLTKTQKDVINIKGLKDKNKIK